MSEKQILSHVENRVGTITLNRPAAMNALAGSMREDLFACLEEFAADDRVGCVVITGAGKAFCAGGDIAAMAEKQAGDDSSMLEDRMTLIGEIVQLMRRMPKPVLAAVNGAAAGGGMNMALACDMRVGSDKALFAQSFVKIGLVPDWGGFFLLTRLVGTSNAMEIMMLGERISAQKAMTLGLLNRIYPAESFAREVRNFAENLAAGPPEALAAIKQGVYLGAIDSLPNALAYELMAQRRAFLSSDAREGIRAFLEKRPPEFGR